MENKMTLFVVPEHFLENLTCDYCHKYLSVKPVKMARRKLICGRCVDIITEEEFVDSYYKLIIDNVLFKCINHYDGCGKLLTSDQVEIHELDCKSRDYYCPLCEFASSKLPTYLIPNHIRTKHKMSLLSKNYFTIKLINLKVNTFFFKKASYLFFIKAEFNTTFASLYVNAVFIGGNDENSDVFQKYYLPHNQRFVATEQRKCLKLDCVNKKITVDTIKIPHVQNQSVTVMFEFEIPALINGIQIIPNLQSDDVEENAVDVP